VLCCVTLITDTTGAMQNITTVINTILDFFLPRSELDTRIAEITAEELTTKVVRDIQGRNRESIVLFSYRDPLIKHMIWSLKYKKNRGVARIFAEVLYDHLVEELFEHAAFSAFIDPLLIPVPLSKKRLRNRGFNQVVWLAQELAAISNNGLCALRTDILERVKETESQTVLKNKRARAENMKDAFRIRNRDAVRGQNIILLDDIITTGSTVAEAERVLRAAGAQRVLVVALAH